MGYIKFLIIGIIIAGTNSLGAESYLCPDNPIKGPWLYEVQNQIPEDEIAPRGNAIQDNSIPDISAIISVPWSEREKNGNSYEDIKWGTDRLIRSGIFVRWISLSHSADMTNKPNYVAIIRYVIGSGSDTVFHYRSTDGINWSPWYHIWGSTNDVEAKKVEILVGRGTNPWVYTFLLFDYEGQPNTGGLRVRRMRADGSTYTWITIATPGDSIDDFAVDMDANEVLYVVYLKRAGATSWGLYRTRSTDQGLTWETPILVSGGNRKDPEIGVGAPNGYAYISYVVDDNIIRIVRYINWSNQFTVDIETDGDPEYAPSIAASRSSSTLTAWCLYKHYHSNTNRYDIHYAYTTDGGSNWTYDVWPPMNYPYIGVAYPWVQTAFDYPSNICGALGTTSQEFDSIITAWAKASTPNSWQDRRVINDYAATGGMPNKIDLNIYLGGSTVVYKESENGNIWFDYWWNTEIKEIVKNVPSSYSIFSKNGYAILKFNLPYGRNLKIDIYSSSGRDINRIERYFSAGNHTLKIDLQNKGVYFFKLPDKTEKVINIK